jgi:hypothetical protein
LKTSSQLPVVSSQLMRRRDSGRAFLSLCGLSVQITVDG